MAGENWGRGRIGVGVALVVENEPEVFTAMIALKEGQGSFADALIGALGVKARCSRTLTFDQKAARLSSFALV